MLLGFYHSTYTKRLLPDLSRNFDKSLEALSKLNDDEKAVVKESKSTLNLLSKSETSAKKAEDKLKKAKEVGDKETAIYLKKASKLTGNGPSIMTSAKAAAVVSSNQ